MKEYNTSTREDSRKAQAAYFISIYRNALTLPYLEISLHLKRSDAYI